MSQVHPHLFRRWPRGLSLRAAAPVDAYTLAALGLAAVVVALAALLPGAGLGPVFAALVSFGLAATVAGRALQRAYPHERLGLCNGITLGRLAMAMALVAPLTAGAGASWGVFTVATIALTLDGLDGWLARRQGLVSAFGARFDMEVDSALALVLALSAAVASGAGVLAILLGLPRYLFAAACAVFPWMRHDLPDRLSRKTVCVLQLGALIALQAPILPDGVALALVLMAASALAWSFALDIAWLWRRRA